MKITNFEDTGLKRVDNFIKENSEITLLELKEILKTVNISFVLEEITRLESMLICELKDSYVQQSQRYVNAEGNSYFIPKMNEEDEKQARTLIDKLYKFYSEISSLKDDLKVKGRPKLENYKYSIPIEDARYILPVLASTNLSLTLSGDKLIDFIKLIAMPKYSEIFSNIRVDFFKKIPKSIIDNILKYDINYDDAKITKFFEEDFKKLDNHDDIVLLSSFENLDINVGIGALTSTNKDAPSKVYSKFGDDVLEKSRGIINRVLSYGHDSISEQARTTFAMKCSLVTYHQQIRHRLSENHRESFEELLKSSRGMVIPPSIKNSPFFVEFSELVNEVKEFREYVYNQYGFQNALYFLLNCEEIKVIIASNARNDNKIMSERLCLNSQWEIRNLYTKKYFILNKLSDVLYKQGVPSCVYDKCHEGKLSCGKQELVKKMFKSVFEPH